MYLVLLACDLVSLNLFITFYYTRWHLPLASLLFFCAFLYALLASNIFKEKKYVDVLSEIVGDNSKSAALLSAIPDFSDEFVSIPASEPNVLKCLGDLYSNCNQYLTCEELTVLCERVADEFVVTQGWMDYSINCVRGTAHQPRSAIKLSPQANLQQ